MTRHERAVREALDFVARMEKVKQLSGDDLPVGEFVPGDIVLQVSTEYQGRKGEVCDIVLNVRLDVDFPLVIPKVYVDALFLHALRLLPHINRQGQICTFDTETSRTIPSEPGRVVMECVHRAKRIIEEGLKGQNGADYEHEFIAYWENRYHEEDTVFDGYLCLVENPSEGLLKLVRLDKEIGGFIYVIFREDSVSENFFECLKRFGRSYNELPLCYLGELSIDLKPPFSMTHSATDALVARNGKSKRDAYIAFVNSKGKEKTVTATIVANGKPHLIGWIIDDFARVKSKKIRGGVLTNYMAMKTVYGNVYVRRIGIQNYTLNRLFLRTDGSLFPVEKQKSFLVAGLGSIGSNLLHFLNALPTPKLTLVDPDRLSLENINRHYLGFAYGNKFKSQVLKDFLKAKNPLQDIESFPHSVIKLYNEDPQLFNDSDLIFLATGRTNIEYFIATEQRLGHITKPIVMLWVEPFLSAGHLLYLHPGGKSIGHYFDDDGFFKFNIISKSEYLSNNPLLYMREAGCQTTYVPYAQSNVVEFLATAFPLIKMLIYEGSESISATWVGNLSVLLENDVLLARKDCKEGSMIINDTHGL